MKHIHDRKILHRDLKTQNIFLTSKGEIKIGDFGIARVLQHTYDCAQTAIGTPYYLSPEICQEKPYNQKSDIWSLGCIFYEMVTLKHAFDANSMKALVIKILRGNYPPIPNCYSTELKSLIDELLQKDPHRRPSIKRFLEKEFLSNRITNLLSQTVAKHEFGRTFETNEPAGPQAPKDPNARDPRGRRAEEVKRPLTAANPPPEERKRDSSASRAGYADASPRRSNPSVENNRKENKYADVVQSLQQARDKTAPEDENFNDDKVEIRFNFKTPEGIAIPGMHAEDSAWSKIEALRLYLENSLGTDKLITAYQYLCDPPEGEEETEQLRNILGRALVKYIPLIYQLIVCEDNYYH